MGKPIFPRPRNATFLLKEEEEKLDDDDDDDDDGVVLLAEKTLSNEARVQDGQRRAP